ncbi:MAG: carboxypeptidase regulatory-like domain-containing protein, partial [Vicinamibacteraceae bacterium]
MGFLFLGAALGFAQQTTGTVRGVVRDAQGAVVPDVRLELLNTATGAAQTQTSTANGLYVFNLVPPGIYVLTTEMAGFRPAAVTDILVEVNKVTTIDVRLETGGIQETVEVTASRPRIDTSSAQVSTNIERRDIEALPSFNRSILELVELAPGVDFNLGPTSGGQVLNIEGVGASVNGNRNGRNSFYLDGVDNTGVFRNQGLNFPNPDTVQEIQVATSNTSAEFGRQPGGSFNVVTKSGTNQFRGTGAYFFRNKQLNA